MSLPASFGKYFLTEKLATGGMAEIYRGKLFGPGGFEKQLVIKQIHPTLASHRQFVEMFVAEAKTTVSLTHGNIVPVYELGVVDGTYFIAMEYVDGPTLAELLHAAAIRGRRLEPPHAAYLCVEVLKGLDYAHRKGAGVIHRDLSPRNVILSREGEVKILDFGLAATIESAAEVSQLSSGEGRPVGSFPYMSPEQSLREPLDTRTDLFSCGILLWEMLTSQSLFQRPADDDTLEAVRTGPIAPPSSIAPHVPRELDEICLRALERDPARRWPAAGPFMAALGRYLYGVDPGVTPERMSQLVAELCPDVPRTEDPVPDGIAAALADTPVPGPDATRPMSASKPDNGTRPMERSSSPPPARTPFAQSFATHVALEKLLSGTWDALPMPSSKPAATAPPSAAPNLRPTWGRRRLAIAIAVGAGMVVAAVAVIALLPRGGVAPAASAGVTVPDAGLVASAPPPPDAARTPVDAARASAAPDGDEAHPIRKPAGKGRLTIGTDAAWANVYVDGRMLGRTPFRRDVAAGPHRVRVVCDPAVCPPDGRTKELSVDVPVGGDRKEVVLFR